MNVDFVMLEGRLSIHRTPFVVPDRSLVRPGVRLVRVSAPDREADGPFVASDASFALPVGVQSIRVA